MKINETPKPKVFVPFTITIETEQEAKMLWLALDQCDAVMYDNAKASRIEINPSDIRVSNSMFYNIDKIYSPKREG